MLPELVSLNTSERLRQVQDRVENLKPRGDFEGSVTGTWVKLDQSGAGLVQYKNKIYSSIPIGFTSIPAGLRVKLAYAAGTYYSSF
jgi:hypothetical protein